MDYISSSQLYFFQAYIQWTTITGVPLQGWKQVRLVQNRLQQGRQVLHSILVVIFIILGVETVEDGSSEREDGGSPGQAVAPVKLVVHPQADRLDELDGEQNQAAHLEHHCRSDQERRWWKTKQYEIWCLLIVICAGT